MWADSQIVDRWSSYTNHETPISEFRTQKSVAYNNFSEVIMLPTSFGIKTWVRCMSCGNQLPSYRTDGAGSEIWGDIALSIYGGNLYNYNNSCIDSSGNWK